MARIYKESRYVLQLLIGKSYGAQYEDVKISFYTKNPSNQVMVDNDITIKRNIAEVMVDSTLFDNLEEGLIKYIVYGTKDGIPFIEERQSNYFLKAPLDFKPTTCILEDKSVTPSMADRDGNNLIVVEESEGYDGLSRVVIDPQTLYNEGVEAGRADIAANARVLNVTENGNYLSKFSDPILPTVTGVYADGTDFYNYAELNGKVFNTKIAGSLDSRLEFWYKGDNTLASDFWNVIIGSGDIDNSDCFQVRYFIDLNSQLSIEVGNSNILIDNWDDTVWHHLIISKAEGLWIDGEKKGDFSPSNTINGEFFINGIGYNADGSRSANGTFGMIKIDNTIIIPTADGFQNVNTGELLEVVHNGDYTFTENLPISPEGELYKTINVNVPQGIASCNLGETEFEFGISDFNDIYELYSSDEGYDGWSKVTIRFDNNDWANIYNAGQVFKDYSWASPGIGNHSYVCGKITEIQEVNTSAENNYASFTLDNCFKISKAKWNYNNKFEFEREDQIKVGACAVVFGVFQDNNGSLQFEEGTSIIIAYEECKPKINVQEVGLKFSRSTFAEVPEWADFEGITDMMRMFQYCSNLQTIPLIDTSNVTDMSYMFGACQNLQTIPLLNTSNVTNMTFMFADCNSLQTMPLLNTSKVTDMSYMLEGCSNLQTIPLLDTSNVRDMCYMLSICSNLQTIPLLNTSNVTDMHNMFEGCSKLQTIPLLNTSNVTNMSRMFEDCSKLQTIPQIDTSNVTDMHSMFDGCHNLQTLPKFNCQKVTNMFSYFSYYSDDMSSLTDVGGWENLKCNWDDAFGLATCPNLTHQSCINILNGLYDFVGNGESTTKTLRVHPNFLTTVGDEISIGRNKGWQITA